MTCHSGDFALQATLRVAIKPNLQGLWMLYGDRLEKQNVKVHLTNVVKKKYVNDPKRKTFRYVIKLNFYQKSLK